jgi:hypothetical protein
VIRIDLSATLGCFLGIQERACSHSKSSSNHICSIAPRMFTGSTIRVETGLLSGRKLICPTQRTCPHQTSLPAPGTPQQHQEARTTSLIVHSLGSLSTEADGNQRNSLCHNHLSQSEYSSRMAIQTACGWSSAQTG